MIESIKVSEKAKQQLIQLKRKTGIDQWNTLCRWAFCLSLAESSIPPFEEIPADSNLEMTWKTFSGQYGQVYEAILKQRLIEDDLSVEEAPYWFRIHLHRGISYINNKLEDVSNFTSIIVNTS